jgi:predicted amidohydrolase YtcJ
MDPDVPEAGAILIEGDTIAAVGPEAEILALAGADTRLVDLQGATVTPGFVDSHSHRITQRSKWGLETEAQATDLALSEGWTEICELALSEADFHALVEADARGELHTRVNAYLAVNAFDGGPVDDWYTAYQPGQVISPYLRVAGLKIFIDFDSGRTLLWEQDDLNAFVRERHDEGWQVAMKAIGRQSHDLALTAIEYALDGTSNARHRHRIEHSLGVSDEQLARLAELGVVTAIQPGMPGVVWYEEDIRNLTAEQGQASMFRWPEYLAAGVIAAASPYNPDPRYPEFTDPSHMSPMGVLYRSVTQVGLGGGQPEPWMLDRALSVEELLPMLTTVGVYSVGQDLLRGSLSEGKLADLVVLSADPRAVPPADLLGIDVLVTMVGGEAAYVRPGFEHLVAGPVASPPLGAERNVARDARVQASSQLTDYRATNAVDGSPAFWQAAGFAPQWIELELESPTRVARIVLRVAQDADVPSVHELWLRRAGSELERVAVFDGVTGDGQELTYEPADPIEGVDLVRVETVSLEDFFPAWREFEVLGQTD